MQVALATILIAATLVLLAMAARQWRRRRSLAYLASRRGLKFSPRDPFSLPERYAAAAVMRIGHSPYASNVLFGRWAGGIVRAFDYRCEAGHGPHRLMRRFTVLVVETPVCRPSAIAWRLTDVVDEPVLAPTEDSGQWTVSGDEATAERLERCWPAGDDRAVILEARGRVVLLTCPGRLDAGQLADRLSAVEASINGFRTDSSRSVVG